MIFFENVTIALESIKNNLLRSILTLFIIALGIGCLVGIMTAIDNILSSLNSSFSGMGADSFQITKVEDRRGRRRGKTLKVGPSITYQQYKSFKENYDFGGSKVSTLINAAMTTVEYNGKKTAPVVQVQGIDEDHLSINNITLSKGRGFSPVEYKYGNNFALIGKDVVKEIFDSNQERALHKKILVDGIPYKVIGIIASQGESFGGSEDNMVIVPLMNAKKNFGYQDMNYNLTVALSNPAQMEEAISDAIGTMRPIRKLKAGIDNNFEIKKSDGILSTIKEQTKTIRYATFVIAGLTILGAAIGLMNIMLVSVTERTKEIGVRKALGATKIHVLTQFLTEAVVICIIGGLVGILLGVLLGFAVSKFVNGVFIVPWDWMIAGIIVCISTGLLAGIIPAMRAANLDPIESLRKG